MTFTEYVKLAMRTNSRVKYVNTKPTLQSKRGLDRVMVLADIGLGLWEAGEVGDHIKKHLSQGWPLDIEKINDEIGDILWYIAEWCLFSGSDFEDILERNIKKLERRYPEGEFNIERSINRDEQH